ncbi:McrB family protein [Dehalobacter sp. TBBPA1]|uniref:McrB family protein n=1 Tax=Dehalobacter sp. TBBPA1 TaxID=3235037 RepID=UPI0034A51762
MQRELFEQWLKSKGISSYGNYISRLKNVEEAECDLDDAYDIDKCAALILKFTYSREDQANKEPLRHKIPIKSQSENKTIYESYYEGSNDYKNRISKYVEFRDSQSNEENSISVVDRIKKACDKLLTDGKLLQIEKLEQKYKLFADKFGPEKLKNLDGELLLDTIFNIGNRAGLFYWLEFKNDDEFNTFNFGSIAGGSSFKYIMYKRNSDGKWVTGNPQSPTILTTEEAIELGREIRNKLIAGAVEIAALETTIDEDKYANLVLSQQNTLRINSSNTDMSRLGWVHKYYHMIYPNLIDDFHSIRWQRHGLVCCGIRPESESAYGMAGQYIKLANECGFPVNYITSAINELFGSPVGYYRIGTSDGKISYWNEMRNGGYVSIGWDKLGNLSDYEEQDKTGLKAKLIKVLEKEYSNTPQVIGKYANQILAFYFNIKPQDVIVAVDGEKVLGVGQAAGEYEYREGLAFPHVIKVDWIYLAETRLPNPREGILTTVYAYKEIDNILAIEKLVNTPFIENTGSTDDGVPLTPLTGISLQIENILNRKKQVVLYGPPGTGKTFHAEKACFELAARNNYYKAFANLSAEEKLQICGSDNNKGAVRICCFHPSYGYEDFIEGIKPSAVNGQTVFELENGVFKELCIDALKEPSKKYYLIIDEINRGDISRIFGELIMLIETGKRGKKLILPLSKKPFTVPENVFIVGTMNTADRSIALLDVALRRRFGFIELMPEYNFFKDIVFEGLPLDGWLKGLNKRICENIGKDARNLQIGHSYFLEREKAVTDSEKFKRIVKEDIIPLIEEYCYGDYSLMSKILGDGIVDTMSQLVRYELFSSSDIADLINALLSPCPELRAAFEGEEKDIELSDDESIEVMQ